MSCNERGGRGGARRCALQRVPPLPPAGEGDTGGEGKRPRLTACMRWEKSPLPQRLLAEPLYPYQLTPSPSPTSWERGTVR